MHFLFIILFSQSFLGKTLVKIAKNIYLKFEVYISKNAVEYKFLKGYYLIAALVFFSNK